MLHITCDLCGKMMSEGAERHILKIELFAALDPAQLTEEDLDADHMEEMSQMLEDVEDLDELDELEPASRQMRFDLCPGCRQRYLRNPLGRDGSHKFEFSEN